MERDESVFKQYIPASPVRDHTEKPNVIEQGVVSDEALDRIQKAERGELRARLASILDRGIIEDRLTVDLPDDLHGEWCRNDPLEIRRLQALGFTIDNTYATDRAIHSDGSSSAVIGDVIHMICPKEVKDIISEIRHEQLIKTHAKKKVGRKQFQKEEMEFISNVQGERDDKVIAYSDSSERSVDHRALSDILGTLDDQVKPFDDT